MSRVLPTLAASLAELPDVLATAGAGTAAGLGVAVPLGAVSVLVLQTALTSGRRTALGAGLGVAVVDLSYATAAVIAGGVVTALLSGRETAVRALAVVVLAVIGGRGLVVAWRSGRGPAEAPDAVRPTAPAAAFARFVALTLVNPLTAVYFVVLAGGLGSRLHTVPAAAAFVTGVFAGSLGWHVTLALAGSAAGARLTAAGRRWTALAGHGLVLALAATLARTLT